MPKKSSKFPDRLDFFVSREMRRKVIAIAYHMGLKGVYSKSCKILLEEAIKRYEEDLSPRERADFAKIMVSVAIHEGDLDV